MIQVVFNPVSGASRRRDRLSDLAGHIRAAGRRCEVIPTAYAGHARLIAAAAAANPEVEGVVAMGGDGTIREVAAGLAGGTVPLAVLPAGTENLFAKTFGFTTDPAETAARVLAGRVRRLDLGVARSSDGRSEHFTVVAGVGFDAEVLGRLGKRGGHITRLTYFWPMFRSAGEYRWPPLQVNVDGRPIMNDAGIVLIANAPRYALNLQICADAVADDGLFDVAVMRCRHLGQLAGLAWATVRGTLCGRAGVEHIRGARVEVAGPADAPWECDGEPLGRLPAVFEVLPGALGIFH